MTSKENRCVVTGLGLVSAIGGNVAECWENAIRSVSGIRETHTVDTENCYANLAAEVRDPSVDEVPGAADMDRASRLCVKASAEAMRDAGLETFGDSTRASVIMGSCVGGVVSVEHYYKNGKPASDVVKMPISAIANQVARTFGAGGVVTNVANACAAGTISIAYACDLIRAGKADAVIAGGADAFASVPYAGFLSLHALDAQPCSPFNRCSGITLGEGSGAVIVESYEHAKARGAKIYCEVLGAGVSSDAHHITAPRPDGEGQMHAIRRALENSGLTPADVGYINAHGTGTAKNDEAEFLSLHTIFDGQNDDLTVTSTKAMVGHCLGAAGAVEAVFAIKALTEGIIPPTVGYTEEDLPRLAERAGKIDFCPNKVEKKELTSVMSNSFAFGGNNASILFSKTEGNVQLPEKRERIFVTGLGIVSPIGNGVENYVDTVRADKALEETSAQSAVGQADYAKCDLKMAFYRKLDKFSQLQAVSGMSALLDTNLTVTDENATDIGIVVGTSDGPLSTVCNYEEDLVAKGNAAGSAFKFPNTVYNAAGGYLSICSGIRGYNVTVTSGIQSGLASIAYAVNVIRSGQEKAVLATGTDENSEIITELYEKLGCVTDGKSDGFRLSDGSTTMVLESESGMTARGAKAYAEVLGYGMATKPVPFGTLAGSGEALDEAISAALSDAGLTANDIDGVVGFADGKKVVDDIEAASLARVFGDRKLPVFNIHRYVGEGRAATAALSAVHAALLLSGSLGDGVKSENLGTVRADSLGKLLVISYGAGGSYAAVILSK